MLLEYNLQFFGPDSDGEEKTEPATQKKLSDAREKGQVAKSREVANGLGLLSLFLVLRFGLGFLGNRFIMAFNEMYNMIPRVVVFFNGGMPWNDTGIVFRRMVLDIIITISPVLAVGFLVAFISEVVQVGWKPSAKTLELKPDKLNPINGFKRIFSANSVFELIKSLLKLGLIGLITYLYIKDKKEQLFILYQMTLMQALTLIKDTVIDLGLRISIVYMFIALMDFVYQKVKFAKDMRMTKQEIKEEYKQQEGDPQVKGKIRQRMQQASRRRMMQNLPSADVVITNPTHYAVAIKYDPEVSDAPMVIAKGADHMAAKIKEVAREHKIEIVENKPLARMLYANVDIGQAIPPELYQAVAEVLAFVYHLKGKV